MWDLPESDRTRVSCIGRWILYSWATREAMLSGFFGREFCPVKMESHSPAFQRPEPCPRGTGWSGHLGTWLRCSGLCLSELPEWMAGLSGPHRTPVGPWAWGMPPFCVISCRSTGHPGPGVSSFLWHWPVHTLHCPHVGEGQYALNTSSEAHWLFLSIDTKLWVLWPIQDYNFYCSLCEG